MAFLPQQVEQSTVDIDASEKRQAGMGYAAMEFLVNNLKEEPVNHSHLMAYMISEIESLERNLHLLNTFLEDALKRRREEVAHRIRQVVNGVEDVIDTPVTQTSEKCVTLSLMFNEVENKVSVSRRKVEHLRRELKLEPEPKDEDDNGNHDKSSGNKSPDSNKAIAAGKVPFPLSYEGIKEAGVFPLSFEGIEEMCRKVGERDFRPHKIFKIFVKVWDFRRSVDEIREEVIWSIADFVHEGEDAKASKMRNRPEVPRLKHKLKLESKVSATLSKQVPRRGCGHGGHLRKGKGWR